MKHVKMNTFRRSFFRLSLSFSVLALMLSAIPATASARKAKSMNQDLIPEAQASQGSIALRGMVTDVNNQPLIGATVSQKGTTHATMTDADGRFALNVPATGSLQITYMGYITRTIAVNGKKDLHITLEEDAHKLNDVVVTALGMKRETKALGYSMQTVKGTALLQTREPNVTNALSGKVAGLQVVKSSNGIGGSSKIVIRGNKSLSGNNQPLIVIDGIPMDNFVSGVSDPWGNNGVDMGNGLSDINSDDIETMTVLKGASAAALYGSRAGNGVILITTKSGKKNKGLGLTVNLGMDAESIFLKPKLQNDFAQGNNGDFDATSGSSWGPAMGGNLRPYDNIDNFFQTGVSYNEGVNFQQQVGGTNVFASVNRSDQQGITPGEKLNRTNLMLRANTALDKDKKWKLDVKANYINEHGHNRPLQGMSTGSAFYTLYSLPRSVNVRDWTNPLDDAGNMRWYTNGQSLQENPYWSEKYHTQDDARDRLIGSMSLSYSPTKWLDAKIYGGTDLYTTKNNNKKFGGSYEQPTGLYSEYTESFYENNFNFLVTAHKEENLIGKLGASLSVGGTMMFQGRQKINADAGELRVPNLFTVSNGLNPTTVTNTNVRRRMNSLYAMGQLSWDNYLFLDITGRNDWSSTMNKANQSFFYPSVSLSYVFSQMLQNYKVQLPWWFTFGKVRASFAEVGNDLQPYQLYNNYSVGRNALTYPTAKPGDTFFNPNLKSELIKSWEAGFTLRFLDNRLGLDATWYKTNSTRQLMDLPMSPFSGYKSKKINAGNIQNQGVEVMLDAGIISNPNGFNWNLTANFSLNRNSIVSLAPGIDAYDILDFSDMSIVAQAGGGYGDMYGIKYKRVMDKKDPNYGKIVVNGSGLPEYTDKKEYVGNQNPDCMLGITDEFTYKGFSFSFLIDARIGGEIFSGTDAILHSSGNAAETVVNGRRDDFVVPNTVFYDEKSQSYVPNTKKVSVQDYWKSLAGAGGGNLGLPEQYVYDATNVRLRNVSIGYEFPKKLIAKTPFQKIRVSATVNNLWMIYSHLPGIDPESVSATNTNATGFESLSAPTSRSCVFNLTLGF